MVLHDATPIARAQRTGYKYARAAGLGVKVDKEPDALSSSEMEGVEARAMGLLTPKIEALQSVFKLLDLGGSGRITIRKCAARLLSPPTWQPSHRRMIAPHMRGMVCAPACKFLRLVCVCVSCDVRRLTVFRSCMIDSYQREAAAAAEAAAAEAAAADPKAAAAAAKAAAATPPSPVKLQPQSQKLMLLDLTEAFNELQLKGYAKVDDNGEYGVEFPPFRAMLARHASALEGVDAGGGKKGKKGVRVGDPTAHNFHVNRSFIHGSCVHTLDSRCLQKKKK